jgi:Ca2+-binding EF-hand superfamily protein
MSVDMAKRYPPVAMTFLGEPGYEAYTINLRGPLAQYNNQRCEPEKHRQVQGCWLAYLKKAGGEMVQIALPEKHLVPFCSQKTGRHKSTQKAAFARNRPTINLNNRSSSATAFESLCQEISGALARKKKESKESGKKASDWKHTDAALKMFDIDGDGLIEMHEMLATCARLSITISQAELVMVWPMFSPAPDGTVNIKNFLEVFRKAKLARRDPSAADGLHSHLLEVGKAQRKIRIHQKSQQFEKLGQVAVMLRTYLVRLMKEKNFLPKVLFEMIDLDGGGSIAQSEFRAFLRMDGLELSEVQLQVVWPLLCADESGEMGPKEFSRFIGGARAWSPSMMFDNFTHHMEVASEYKDLLGAFEQTWVCEASKGKGTPKVEGTQRRRLSVSGGPDRKGQAIRRGSVLTTPLDSLLRKVSVAYTGKMGTAPLVRAKMTPPSTTRPLPGLAEDVYAVADAISDTRRRRVSLVNVLERHSGHTSTNTVSGMEYPEEWNTASRGGADGWEEGGEGTREDDDEENDDEYGDRHSHSRQLNVSAPSSLINSALSFCTVEVSPIEVTKSPKGGKRRILNVSPQSTMLPITQQQLRSSAKWRSTVLQQHRERMESVKLDSPMTAKLNHSQRSTHSKGKAVCLSPNQKRIISNCAELRRGFVRIRREVGNGVIDSEAESPVVVGVSRFACEGMQKPPSMLTIEEPAGSGRWSQKDKQKKQRKQKKQLMPLPRSPVKAAFSRESNKLQGVSAGAKMRQARLQALQRKQQMQRLQFLGEMMEAPECWQQHTSGAL